MLSNVCNDKLVDKNYSEREHEALWNFCDQMSGNIKEMDTHVYEAWPVVNGQQNMMLKMMKKLELLRWKKESWRRIWNTRKQWWKKGNPPYER